MWTEQTIFSIGDLCGTAEKEYNDFINKEYGADIRERLKHVKRMITRLEFEQKKIEEKLCNVDI